MMLSIGASAQDDGRPEFVGKIASPGAVRGRFRLAAILSCAVLFSQIAACKRPDEQAQSYALEAQRQANAGDFLTAMQTAQKAISLRDNNPDYFLLLANIQMSAGQEGAAFLSGQRALDVDAANVTALTLVANLGLQVGQVDEAADAADRLLALEPGSLTGLQVKGLVQLYRQQIDAAEATAKQLLTLSPADEAGTIIMVRVLAKRQQFDEALGLIDKAIGQRQATPALLITEINLNRVLARPDDMARAYEQLSKVNEDLPMRFRLDRINLLYKMGRKAEARAAVDAMLRVPGAGLDEFDLLRRIWWEFDPVPFTRETIKSAREWVNPLALVSVGRYLLWKGQPQLADDLFFSFRPEFRPIGQSIHNRAGAALGRADDARRSMNAILEADPDDVDALILRGQLLREAGDTGGAKEAIQKALDTDPNDPEIYAELARLYEKTGSTRSARQTFEDGLLQLPQNFLLIEGYTRFLHESGNKDRAVSVARSFARGLPSSVKAWTIMAEQCAWAGDKSCSAEAAARGKLAEALYNVDDPPGAPPDRGLLGQF